MSLGDPSHDIDDTAPLPEWMQPHSPEFSGGEVLAHTDSLPK